jgi:lipopolysaccharide export LptBFGC system permease protein LptF
MVTLHAYILRELLKIFGLSLLALTILFTMGGGLYNIVSYEGVSAGDVFRFIPLLVPIVITLTMPIAALFAATMVYGRLSADNELTACRAAGINVHRLFLSAILLAVFVSAFTLVFANIIIPSFAQRLETFARNNLRDLVTQHLGNRGFFHYQGKDSGDHYTLTAENAQGVADSALTQKGFETGKGLQYLLITSPTFLHVGTNGALVRFAAARYGLCRFDTRTTPVELTFFVRDARDFEVGQSAVTVDQQQIGPLALPLPSAFRLSAADLRDLLRWRTAPWEVPKQRDELRRFLMEFTCERFYRYCAAHLGDGRELVLLDDDGAEYRIQCTAVVAERRALILEPGQVVVREPRGELRAKYEAPRIRLTAVPLPKGSVVVEIRLIRTGEQDVVEYDARGGVLGEPRRKPTLSLDRVRAPAEVLEEAARYTPAQVIDPAVPLPVGAELADQRAGLQKGVRTEQRKVVGTIHFRLGYTASALVTVLMGAALGVIFRGSRALAAFALALIPFFSVMILMVLGRQLAEDAHLAALGPAVTWGGLLLALAADGVMLRVGVRR